MGSIKNFHYKDSLRKRGIVSSEGLIEALRDCDYELLRRLNITTIVGDLKKNGYITEEEGDFFIMQKSVVHDYSTVTKCAISCKKDLYREWNLFYGTVNRLKVPKCYAPMVLLMYLCYYDREFEYYLKDDTLTLDIDARGICNTIYRFMYYLKINEEKTYKAIGFLFTGFSKARIENYLNISNSEEFYGNILDRMRTLIAVDLERKHIVGGI